MKFSILKENFQETLVIVGRVLPLKPQLPVLNNILLHVENKELIVSASNLETGIKKMVNVKVDAEGAITVPGRLLIEFISSLPAGRIDVVLDKEILTVKTQSIRANFNTLPAKDFIPFPTAKEKVDFIFKFQQLSRSIGKTAFASSVDEGRPVLTGIKIKISGGKISFLATDGYRLSMATEEIAHEDNEELQLVLPARILTEVVRIAGEEKSEQVELFFIKEKNQAIFRVRSVQIVTRIIDGEFPNIEKIIPTGYKTRVLFDVEKLLQTVKIASLFARGASNIIKLKVAKDGVTFSANSPQVGENQDVLEAEVTGEETEIAFNYRFLLDLLNNFSEKQIAFESSGPLNPGVFRPVDSSSFLHIIMPVRLQGG